MRPQDDHTPPPAKLPRPSLNVITDIQGMQRPPRPGGEVSAPAPTAPVPVQQPAVKQPHPNDHLIEASREKLLSDGALTNPPTPPKKRSKLKLFFLCIGVLCALVIAAAASAVWWYQEQLKPVDPASKEQVRVVIEEGSSPSRIASDLQASGVIRNNIAFSVYTKVSGSENNLKAGTFNLKKSETVQQIVDHLVSGKQDTFSIMFLPGDTLANHRKKLLAVGYSAAEVDAALAKQYNRPLFSGRPAGADLEGYIFGETYEFASSASVETILNRTFDEYEKYITAHDLVNGFKKQNLTLYQGITLASIVQREVVGEEDERQVARVFLNRMQAGMTLGSDVTYQYAARKLGVAPTPLLESPYNTRIKKGLPPGPIASPGAGALKAVASPGVNDYLFFLSGDDDVTYFAKTDAEHQKNIVNHCKKKCLIN